MSSFRTLAAPQKLDITAQMRTYDGSYIRYALAIWMFSILITKLFSKDFLAVGIVYVIHGFLVFGIAVWRNAVVTQKGFKDENLGVVLFKTSGNVVSLLSGVCVLCNIAVLVLLCRM